jgi:hypothetical protein
MKAMKAASARQHLDEAQKAMQKKSFFGKLSPDYVTAETNFKRAAQDFKLSGEVDQAVSALQQASVCSVNNRDKYTAAQHLEAAAKMAQSARTAELDAKSLELFDAACKLYNESDNVGNTIDVKYSIGRSLYQKNPEQAAKFLEAAAGLIDPNKPGTIDIDVFALTLNVLVLLRRVPEALAVLRRFTAMCRKLNRRDQLFKNYLSEVILLCAQGDFAGANEAFMDHMQSDDYLQQAEAATSEDLIEAFSKHDAVLLQKARVAFAMY